MYAFFITLALDTPIYLTDFHRDYTIGAITHESGMFNLTQAVKQGTEPKAENFKIDFSAIDGTMVSAFANTPYKNRRCLIQRVELDDDDESVISIETWLDGTLNNYEFICTNTSSYFSVSVGSIFNAFNMVKRRNLDVYFADTINNDDVLYWGKESPNVVIEEENPRDKPFNPITQPWNNPWNPF